MNGIRKVNNTSEHMYNYGGDKPLNNPFGARTNISSYPENNYYRNGPSMSYSQNGQFSGQHMDFYNWEGNSSDDLKVGGGSFSLKKNDGIETNSFNAIDGVNNQFATFTDNNMTYNTPNMMNVTGMQTSMGGVSGGQIPDNNMLGFGNNTSQLVMGIVSNTVKETTGLNSEKISQLQLWFPQTIASLRSHFAVSHEYVLRKIFLIICPFITFFTQNKRKSFSYEGHTSIYSGENDRGICPPTLFSDLYIPLMGFITYVLADGVINGVFSQFNPQILGSTATFSIVLLITEIILFQLVAYIFAARVLSTLDLISTLGYKYTSIVLCDFMLLFTGGVKSHLFWGIFIYLSVSSSLLVYMMLKVISAQSLSNQFSIIQQSGLTVVIFISSLVQVPLCWVLLPSI
ncbi:transmembrane domain-containing protein [Cryptosporidium canis]|uniref:Protein YIF1 n=1 Tax=Cryptosporidium canis TaxID=195482 RepID=A0ABQ8P7N2_9CRYT|nr:transmembrane domain-containing protein [Cryptosporidium canis]KAJ1613868.1 transmembrane domain-containing protein [Cryptosporidium canis]